MQNLKYILRSLFFFRKQHLAVLLATILSTAVLTGALIVGDSVEHSLRSIVKKRLGSVAFVISSGERMIDKELVPKLEQELGTKVSGLIHTQGVAINQNSNLRVNGVNVYGVDSSFWEFADIQSLDVDNGYVFLSRNLASHLNIDTTDFVLLRVNVPQTISLNSPFSQDEERSIALRLKVKVVLNDDSLGRFSLKSDQKLPYNVFVSYNWLASELDKRNKINQILIAENAKLKEHQILEAVSMHWELDDLGLKLTDFSADGVRLTTDQIFLNQRIVDAVNSYNTDYTSVYAYLINDIESGKLNTPYSFIAGVNGVLENNEIVVSSWLAEDLDLKVHDTLTTTYFLFGNYRDLLEDTSQFIVKAIQPLKSGWFSEAVMPDFPGLADAGSCNEWEAGVPIDFEKIREKDEDYWDNYKGTPKAIISYEKAKSLWPNQYGLHTALFFKSSLNMNDFESYLLNAITPESIGMNIAAVQKNGMISARNGVDFGELFLSLSFFVIVSAILLLILIYKINLTTRKAEILTLSAVGLNTKQIAKLFLSESFVTIVFGSFIGSMGGVAYNRAMVAALNSIWNDAVYTNALIPEVTVQSIFIGIISGFIISGLVVFFIIRNQSKQIIATGIKGNEIQNNSRSKIVRRIALICFICFIIMIGFMVVTNNFVPTYTLLLASLFLVSLLFWFNNNLQKLSVFRFKGISKSKLVLRNIAHNRSRSLAVVSLFAIAVFSVLITGANRKTFHTSSFNNQGGAGGYQFWSELTLPVMYDLNTESGKKNMGLDNEPTIDSCSFMQMSEKPGDDASCLNLNQVQQPSILGINASELNLRQSFSFVKLLSEVDKEHPWEFLNVQLGEKLYPVYLDQTVITWGLMKKVGDTLEVLSGVGDSVKFVIAGGMEASIFQGHMLISSNLFNQLFPDNVGTKTMLVDCPQSKQTEVNEILSYVLSDYGIMLDQTNERLARFYSVTNTYLNVFMVLGALAILIGTIGLGLVVYRSLLDRKREYAVLKAIGLKGKSVSGIIFSEYFSLMLAGITFGLLAAVIGMLPSFMSESFSLPMRFLMVLMLIVFANGILWIIFPIWLTKKQSIASVLKIE